jgi:hypothetical protein
MGTPFLASRVVTNLGRTSHSYYDGWKLPGTRVPQKMALLAYGRPQGANPECIHPTKLNFNFKGGY